MVEGARHGTSGVTMTCPEAMEALSRTLIEGEGFSLGKVVPMTLVDGVGESFYIYGIPQHIAEYREGVIHWRHGMEAS